MHLSLRQLSYLVAVIDAGSLTRAADSLNVTPTSLSLQMKHLEEMVGARLLLRHSRGVSATEAGSIVCDHARDILSRVSELEHFILGGGIAAPRALRVGAVPAVTRMLGIEVIAAAAQTLKGTTLHLSEGWSGDLLEKLAAGALDFVIAYDLDPYDDIEVVTFFEDEFVFICHPDRHPGPAEIDLADALTSDLVFYGQSSVSWRAVTEVAAQRNLPVHGDREVQSIDVWRGLLCRGLGTSVGPFGSVRDEVLRGELSVKRLSGSPIMRPVTMAARHETLAMGRRIGFVDLVSDLIGATRPDFSIGDRAEPDAVA
ncbi:LysR family transcriptional regulator [Roseicyclus mahoneyensis]|nr:LysR family transcriptional regulator [Roseicyclus mahoneyensis]